MSFVNTVLNGLLSNGLPRFSAANDPMHQFIVKPLFKIPVPLGDTVLDFSFTNSSLYMVLAVAVILGFLIFSVSSRALVPSRTQLVAEMSYEFVANLMRDTVGREGLRYFPFIYSLFMFILVCNMLGMIPHSFTVTSHIIVTFALAMAVFVAIIAIGLARNGLGFLKLFVPSGVPIVLLPLVTVIEIFSFFTRPVSLSIRLFANILAGHITLKVFAGFIFMMGSAGYLGALGAIGPLLMTIALTALEILVAFLQAYVFAVLSSIYLNDALHPGH